MSHLGYTVIEVRLLGPTRKLFVWGTAIKPIYIDQGRYITLGKWYPCQIQHACYMEYRLGGEEMFGSEQECKAKLDQINDPLEFGKENGIVHKIWYPTQDELDGLAKLSDLDYLRKVTLVAQEYKPRVVR